MDNGICVRAYGQGHVGKDILARTYGQGHTLMLRTFNSPSTISGGELLVKGRLWWMGCNKLIVSIFNDHDKAILKVVNHTSPPLEGRASTCLDLLYSKWIHRNLFKKWDQVLYIINFNF